MKTNTSWKRFVIVVALGVALSGVTTHPTVSKATDADLKAHSELSGRRIMPTESAQGVDVVTEWNRQAVTLTLLPASSSTPSKSSKRKSNNSRTK